MPPDKRVLVLGCGNGHLLDALEPSYGVGVDFSPTKVARAKNAHPRLTFLCDDVENLSNTSELAGTFDVIVMPDTIGSLDDCLTTFQGLHRFCKPETRLIVSYYTRLWDPIQVFYAKLAAKHDYVRRNWLANQDIVNLLQLADFDVVKREWRMLSPFRLFGLGRLINRFIATLPLFRKLCLRNLRGCAPTPHTAQHAVIGFHRDSLPKRARAILKLPYSAFRASVRKLRSSLSRATAMMAPGRKCRE